MGDSLITKFTCFNVIYNIQRLQKSKRRKSLREVLSPSYQYLRRQTTGRVSCIFQADDLEDKPCFAGHDVARCKAGEEEGGKAVETDRASVDMEWDGQGGKSYETQ